MATRGPFGELSFELDIITIIFKVAVAVVVVRGA